MDEDYFKAVFEFKRVIVSFCMMNVLFKYYFYYFCSPKKSSCTIDGFLQKKQTCTPEQATAITDSVLNMLVSDIRRWGRVSADDSPAQPRVHPAIESSFHQLDEEKI